MENKTTNRNKKGIAIALLLLLGFGGSQIIGIDNTKTVESHVPYAAAATVQTQDVQPVPATEDTENETVVVAEAPAAIRVNAVVTGASVAGDMTVAVMDSAVTVEAAPVVETVLEEDVPMTALPDVMVIPAAANREVSGIFDFSYDGTTDRTESEKTEEVTVTENVGNILPNNSEAIAAAQENLQNAQDNLTEAQEVLSDATVALEGAKQDLSDAKQNLNDAQENLQDAKDNLETAKQNLEVAKADKETTAAELEEVQNQVNEAIENLNAAKEEENAAQTEYNQLQSQMTEANQAKADAQAAYEAAKASYAREYMAALAIEEHVGEVKLLGEFDKNSDKDKWTGWMYKEKVNGVNSLVAVQLLGDDAFWKVERNYMLDFNFDGYGSAYTVNNVTLHAYKAVLKGNEYAFAVDGNIVSLEDAGKVIDSYNQAVKDLEKAEEALSQCDADKLAAALQRLEAARDHQTALQRAYENVVTALEHAKQADKDAQDAVNAADSAVTDATEAEQAAETAVKDAEAVVSEKENAVSEQETVVEEATASVAAAGEAVEDAEAAVNELTAE